MLVHEELLTFAEAAAKLPRRNGKRLHVSTMWRWARKGIKGVRLEVRRLGGRFYTSLEAIERFSRALAEIEVTDRGPVLKKQKTRSAKQRQRDIERAEEELDRAGI